MSHSPDFFGFHPEAWVVGDGREPGVREARRDGVDIRDQYIAPNNMRGVR